VIRLSIAHCLHLEELLVDAGFPNKQLMIAVFNNTAARQKENSARPPRTQRHPVHISPLPDPRQPVLTRLLLWRVPESQLAKEIQSTDSGPFDIGKDLDVY
jgi:hypothetical protein